MAAGDIRIIKELAGGNFEEVALSASQGMIAFDAAGNLVVVSGVGSNTKTIHTQTNDDLDFQLSLADIFVVTLETVTNYSITMDGLLSGEEKTFFIKNAAGGQVTVYLPTDGDYATASSFSIDHDYTIEVSVVNVGGSRYWQVSPQLGLVQ